MSGDSPSEKRSRECFVSGIRIKKLWGYRNLELPFTRGDNILIGRNATGKTSVINILRYLLTLDLPSLLEVKFEEASVTLETFEGGERHYLSARIGVQSLVISLDTERFEVEVPASLRDRYLGDIGPAEDIKRRRLVASLRNSELKLKLQALVPSVWLPVNRGGFSRDDEEYYLRADRERRSIGTVEDRLDLLLDELRSYRLALEAKLSSKYKEFEKRVLSLILYNKEYDNIAKFKWESVSSDDERAQLVKAFHEAGLLDSDMQKRIDEHFAAQTEAIRRVKAQSSGGTSSVVFADLFIAPLVRRTKEMINYAGMIETDKKEIFSGLTKYCAIVSEFLHDKTVDVSDKGILQINFANPKNFNLTYRHLSSGEKQILILLTQALIFEGRPVVYVADEPELSLHVTWQEKLLKSLRALNPQMQLIIATHSPDIVGRRLTLDLERYSNE